MNRFAFDERSITFAYGHHDAPLIAIFAWDIG